MPDDDGVRAPPITVDELARDVRERLGAIKNVDVIGTVGRVARPRSGHAYFELVGASARMGCVAWSSSSLHVEEGEARVRVRHVDFYPPQGRCQASVSEFEATGAASATASARFRPR